MNATQQHATAPTALVTGAARRIGARIAADLVQRGYALHLHAHTSHHHLAEVADDLRRRHSVEVHTHIADLSDTTAVTRAVLVIEPLA